MANNINEGRRLAGVANLTIDGNAYDLVGDLSYNPSVVTRATLVGQDGIHGYSEMPFASFISCTLRDNGGFAVLGFNQLTSSIVQSSIANGKQIVGSGMWCVETEEVNTVEGTFRVRFESDNVQEVLVS